MSNGGFYNFCSSLFLAKLIIGKFWKKSGFFFPIEDTFVNFWQFFMHNSRWKKFAKIFARNFIHIWFVRALFWIMVFFIYRSIIKNIFQFFFFSKHRNFYMHFEQMVDCDYSQVERALRKIYFSHSCTEMATFFAWNAGRKYPFWGTQEKCGMQEYLFHILEYFSNIQVLPLKIQSVLNKSDIQKVKLIFLQTYSYKRRQRWWLI